MALPSASLTLATLRSAEFGFLGLTVKIFEQTALRWGFPASAGAFGGRIRGFRFPLNAWLSVACAGAAHENALTDEGGRTGCDPSRPRRIRPVPAA